MIEEAKGKDAEDKGSAKGEAPEASLALHLVSEGIVEKKSDSIASPSGKNKGAEASYLDHEPSEKAAEDKSAN